MLFRLFATQSKILTVPDHHSSRQIEFHEVFSNDFTVDVIQMIGWDSQTFANRLIYNINSYLIELGLLLKNSVH